LPALVRGTLAHALLERLDFARPAPPTPADVAAVAAERAVVVGDQAAAELSALVAGFAASPLCRRLSAASAVRREAPFGFPLEAPGGAVLVNGVVDVIASEDRGTLIVDYKTDPLEPGEDPAVRAAGDYAVQRLVYALAALRDGAEGVEVAHCFLERPDAPATTTFAAGDLARLERELGQLAAGALAGEFPVTDRPHRGLCATCPGRAALCSHPEELTLRELEPAPD
jgi:ATP-dependent exoDNAse (exonuclease V) beta subunit